MSKVLPATCQDNQVTVEGQVIEAEILSNGVGESSGLAIIDEDKAYYLPNMTSDISTILTDLSTMIKDIAAMLTAIGAGMTGPTTAPPPTLAADVAALQAKAQELDAFGEDLI